MDDVTGPATTRTFRPVALVASSALRAFPAAQRLLELGGFGRPAVLEGILEDEGVRRQGRLAVEEGLGRAFPVLDDQLAETREVGGPKHPGQT